MKRFVLCMLASAAVVSASGAPSPDPNAMPPNMEAFMVVLLVRPPNAPDFPKEKLDELQAAHIDNIKRMAAEGKLLKAGPFDDLSGRNVRGMYIFNAQSREQVEAWVATDPLVKAGRLVPEYLKWYIQKGSLK